jgi:hypothetical protein
MISSSSGLDRLTGQPERGRLVPATSRNQIVALPFALNSKARTKEVVMTKLPVLMAVAAGLALAACDNSTPPTKAPGDTVNQLDKNPMPNSAASGDQPGAPSK